MTIERVNVFAENRAPAKMIEKKIISILKSGSSKETIGRDASGNMYTSDGVATLYADTNRRKWAPPACTAPSAGSSPKLKWMWFKVARSQLAADAPTPTSVGRDHGNLRAPPALPPTFGGRLKGVFICHVDEKTAELQGRDIRIDRLNRDQNQTILKGSLFAFDYGTLSMTRTAEAAVCGTAGDG
ncbi:hypothetical protein EVAR_75270_1 [Eumeta japonica]|uniref:Uncharacterized protein n=1 Tax=Eumeta variegata TaxID=151549 RepID=A0A4C1V9U4_EUMVA|nr:hypothetical protein EVAR_75270_1 [Eumeta japonica]